MPGRFEEKLKQLNNLKKAVLIQRDFKKRGIFDKKITSIDDARNLAGSIMEIIRDHGIDVPTTLPDAIDFLKKKLSEYFDSDQNSTDKQGLINKILQFFLKRKEQKR